MTLIVVTAAVASLLLQGLFLPVLRHLAMDLPNRRSSHAVPTPRGGGVAVALAIGFGMWAASLGYQPVAWAPVTALFAFAALGFVEDVRGVGVATRLGTQVVLGGGLALWLLLDGTALRGVGLALAVTLAALWVAGFTNAFNFMDGINGISGMNAVVASGWFCYLGLRWDLPEVTVVAVAVAGAAAGFLPWNIPYARIFLGDAGSYVLGASLAGLGLMALIGGAPLNAVVAPFVIYLADTAWTLARRLAGRRTWREAHREHVYQRLVDGGASHVQVSLLSAAVALLCCVALGFNEGASLGVGVVVVAFMTTCYLGLPSAAAQVSAAALQHRIRA